MSLQFIITFVIDGVDLSYVSLWGSDWGNLFGVVLFNFAAVLSVPAWLYEREKSVDVGKGKESKQNDLNLMILDQLLFHVLSTMIVISFSSIIGVILYILVGGLGALTMPKVSSNMLLFMMSGM